MFQFIVNLFRKKTPVAEQSVVVDQVAETPEDSAAKRWSRFNARLATGTPIQTPPQSVVEEDDGLSTALMTAIVLDSLSSSPSCADSTPSEEFVGGGGSSDSWDSPSSDSSSDSSSSCDSNSDSSSDSSCSDS